MTTKEYLYEYRKGKDTLTYTDLEVINPNPKCRDEETIFVDYDYEIDINEIIEALRDICDPEDLPDDLEEDMDFEYIQEHYDMFREKYDQQLLDAFEDRVRDEL